MLKRKSHNITMISSEVSDAMLEELDKIARTLTKVQNDNALLLRDKIFKVAICTATFANIITKFNVNANPTRPLLSKSTVKGLNQIAQEMNDLKKRHRVLFQTLAMIACCTAHLSMIMKEFFLQNNKIIKKLNKINEDMKNLYDEPGSRLPDYNLKEVTSNIKNLTHIMKGLITKRSQTGKYPKKYEWWKLNNDNWYQTHKAVARRINSCDEFDYEEILELEGQYADETYRRDAADIAFVAFSNLFDPHSSKGSKYYQGAQKAHDRKS
jgi:hypothetical protein